MVSVCNIRQRTSDLDSRMQKAKRELAELERAEAEEIARKKAETRRAFEREWEEFKPTFERFLGLSQKIRELEDDWRRVVFRGKEQTDEQIDQLLRGLHALWLAYSPMFKERAEFLQRNLRERADLAESVEGIGRTANEVAHLLRTWEPPMLSRGYSFRAPPLSQEAAARFNEMFPKTK